ncbi:MAG: hypothetical protein ACYS0H_16110 [Planctomycetota bacterium]|jgi:hypothetical protein
MADIVATAAEISGDPLGRGYAGMTDAEALADLKTEYVTKDVVSVTGQQVFEAAVPAEFNALSAEQKTLFLGIVGMGTILVNGTNTKAALAAMFAATTTLTNLIALQTETISRETDLGLGNLREGDIQMARAL